MTGYVSGHNINRISGRGPRCGHLASLGHARAVKGCGHDTVRMSSPKSGQTAYGHGLKTGNVERERAVLDISD